MTKQLTRKEVEAVVERLGNAKYLDLLLLGGVSVTMDLNIIRELWKPLGFSKSLQEIIKASGYEKKYHVIDGKFSSERYIIGLKSPEANALFSFLQEIL